MNFTTGTLGRLIRNAGNHHFQHMLYVARPIDDCWADTWAAVIETDLYEEEPDPVTILGVDYHPCLGVHTVNGIRSNVVAQVPNPSDDLYVAALKHYFHLDGFMSITDVADQWG